MSSIDPIVSLAFGMHSNPGVYALLVGSGISRSAEIPTGWEVILKLTRKVAALENENCEPAPEEWYLKRFGKAPDYSKILELVAKLPAERQRLLRGYFEPTDDERAEGKKMPTKAHRAIAELVRSEHVRVVITTNFDGLLEQAMHDVGVYPDVVSTADAAEGCVPLSHTKALIIKVHGDYRDARIKNTETELLSYDPRIDALLARVVEEFGMVVCGWSAEWDIALRAVFERCKNRRYSMYWAARSAPTAAAQSLVRARSAEFIKIADADTFFPQLAEHVASLTALDRPHPLSAAMASATIKRYILLPHEAIRVHDLVHDAVEQLVVATTDEAMPCTGVPPWIAANVTARVEQYEAATEVVRAMLVAGCTWGNENHFEIWRAAIRRVSSKDSIGGSDGYVELRTYPGLLLLYAAGVAATAAGRFDTLRALLTVHVRMGDKEEPAYEALAQYRVFNDERAAALLQGAVRQGGMLSLRIAALLRSSLAPYVADRVDYHSMVERFEYLWALFTLEREHVRGGNPGMTMFHRGRFAYNRDFMTGVSKPVAALDAAIKAQGNAWPGFKQGLFRDFDSYNVAASLIGADISRMGREYL